MRVLIYLLCVNDFICMCGFGPNSASFCLLDNPALINNKCVGVSVVWGFSFNRVCPFVLLWACPVLDSSLSYFPVVDPLLSRIPVVTSALLFSWWSVGVLRQESGTQKPGCATRESGMCPGSQCHCFYRVWTTIQKQKHHQVWSPDLDSLMVEGGVGSGQESIFC